MSDGQIALQSRHQRAERDDLAAQRRKDQQGPARLSEDGLADIVKTKNRSIKVERIALVGIDDVPRIDGPVALQFRQVFLGQRVAQPRIAGGKGKDWARVMRRDKIMQSA